MRPCLVVLILLASTTLARYHEKTRFDRSVHEYETRDAENNHEEKQWSFTDDVTQFVAYKSRKENDCYLEDIKQGQNVSRKKRQFKILYASAALTKLEAWRLAGGRIVDFCNGRNILLLQTTKHVPGRALDPFFNEIPVDENDILPKRIVDIVLTPLKARTKRQIQLEHRKKSTKSVNRIRRRRQTSQFRGKFRGQTQSQYLNFDSNEKKEGTAEAEATQQSSRAVVSGSRGMGQAQSMSSGGTGCEDCPGYPGYPGIEGTPDKIQVPPVATGIPGITQPGTGVIPGVTPFPGGQITYPGGVRPGTGGVRPGTYPGVQPGVQPGQGVYPPGGIVTTSVTTGATTVTGVGTYPVSIPGTGLPSGTYPGIPGTGTHPGTGVYPGGVRPDIPGTSAGTYPSNVVPGGTTTQGVYPGQQTVVFPPQGQPTNGQVVYPDGTVQPGTIPGRPGSVPGTQVTYPSVTYPGVIPGTYPGGVQQITSPGGTLYPGQVVYPNGQVPTYPGGQYPGIGIVQYPIGTTGSQTIGGTGVTGQYPGQLPGGISGPGIDSGQYPGQLYPGTTGVGTTGTGDVSQYYPQTGGPARPVGPGGPIGAADDGTESQASSSVQQVDSGTQASASAQGKYGSGTAQSQVTGTYSGSGTFSAQAGTSDADKSAQAEVNGGKEGATGNAQGIAGYGKSQTQVQLDSDSGATSTGAQSSGWNHGTNSQVQASSKGGMADAQANGEGSTSSQAQIGFQPYLKSDDEKVEKHTTPFRGSGTASAQSGTHRGQSQTQLQGSFQYGITYTGAAQAGSGSGAASSRKPFNFTDTELFKPFIKPAPPLKRPTNVDASAQSGRSASSNYDNRQDENKQDREQGLQSSSTSRQTVVLASKNNPDDAGDKKVRATEKPRTDDSTYDEYDDDYADEDDYPTATNSRLTIKEKFAGIFPGPSASHQKPDRTFQQQSRGQSQTIQVAKGNQYNVHVSQDSNAPRSGDTLQPGQTVSGYTIPPGFRGRIMSTSGTETVAQGDGKSQSQTVSLVAKDSNNTRSSPTETRSLQTNHGRYIGRQTSTSHGSPVNQNVYSDKYTRPTPAIAAKPSYYTVTNSFAGKMNGSNEPRKYEHRYYTKSSTCGYFTFSCNVVYGSNGRTKICKPKVPTYPDGTPMRC
ncbi:PREDICTED: uncharacterized protein LOC105558934 [Vollenhovia emeryi]|uniref:uncharacterized protein LOC105558934 n=1 Tax=Vollenhovia emeryi TaxID=411798 RepID=UPI0005F514A1|nr:PREDICTED: uncharacterized protein LOC105558934 [Vollenhovia emeryi]